MKPPVFLRRLGPAKASCEALESCPDVVLLDNGDFAIIGEDVTHFAAGRLPAGVSVGPNERVVVVPRAVLVGAKPDIPSA